MPGDTSRFLNVFTARTFGIILLRACGRRAVFDPLDQEARARNYGMGQKMAGFFSEKNVGGVCCEIQVLLQ